MNDETPNTHTNYLELHAILLRFALDNGWSEREVLSFLTATLIGQLAMSDCSEEKILLTGEVIAKKALMKRLDPTFMREGE